MTRLAPDRLHERARALAELMGPCRLCPRACGVDRRVGETGFCRAGREPVVASACRHRGEEPPLSGTRGSGTIFLAHCNLRCVYCQNHQISQRVAPEPEWRIGVEPLVEAIMELANQDCHNINFVSPTHFAPDLVEALARTAQRGLHLPIVYNTNAYDSLDALRLLDGVVDIYLPDLKYADAAAAERYSQAPEYVVHARAAIAEMWRQAGPLVCDDGGVAQRGLLVRHLVLPNDLADTEASLRWLRETCGPEVAVSLMAQYGPAWRAEGEPLLSRRVSAREYARAVECALDLGLHRLLTQDPAEAPAHYRPDFSRRAHPFECGMK